MKVRVLGCGTSSGVPRIGNDWGLCDPSEPRNRRTRVSVLVEHEGTRILVDTGPDMRQQLLAAGVGTVDAVIWTHEHADHVFGIDDLRQIYHQIGRPVTGFARRRTGAKLKTMFGYVFAGQDEYPPTVSLHELPDAFTIGSINLRVVDQPHGAITSAGLRFEADGKAFGYATDISGMSEQMRSLYSGLDLWIVDALRRRTHPTHPSLEQALGWINELQPRRAALTHMDHSMDYASLLAELPSGVEPCFDGQEFML
ncbi:MBL fold metallo-hydrolase [Sphingomonas sp. IC4-52]|uniref:MBL fold metallo-hydrolase n=1 Tax=Sphingomonas sp. IC4-52 TaxID=2887202 RepID=UPI001D10EA5B|nr:MBL fold metallo-hydrolase [Sphingomonas sp. IC4-52]MCC2978909.1 MBL fold metallo-hydrolase [Sphingomonas sp. IC4-52]